MASKKDELLTRINATLERRIGNITEFADGISKEVPEAILIPEYLTMVAAMQNYQKALLKKAYDN